MLFMFKILMLNFLVFSFIMNNKHLLMMLLILEAIMLFFLFNFYFFLNFSSIYMFLAFITLSACEGALGLSVLVSVTRSYGSDYLSMFSSVV